MMITYRQRRYLDKYKCIDTPVRVRVKGLAFSNGELLYYKKNDFEYFTIAKEDILSIEE